VGGTNWTQILNAQEFLSTTEKVYMRWLTVAPSDADVVYALASIKYYDQGILLRSTDGGDEWARSDSIVDGKGVCLAVDPHDPQRLYLGSWYAGVYRSTDGGSTWQPINAGLPTSHALVRSIAIDPVDTQRVYIGVGGQVYQSTDGGDHWNGIGNVLPAEVQRMAVGTNGTVYAAVYGEGVYRLVHAVYLPIVLERAGL